MDTQILEDIGLTKAEVKVYIALLELGPTSAGAILERTGVQNSVVHMTLNRLIEKGFVSYYLEGKRTHYQASNPQHISEYIEEKKARFEQILPELLGRREQAAQRAEVTTFRGKKGVRELLEELLDAGGKFHYTIGSPVESVMMGDAFWLDYHKKRAKKKIFGKLIFNESLRAWTQEVTSAGHYPHAEIRFMSEGFEPLTETIIRNNQVGIILWTEKPTGILVSSAQLANSYEKYFEFLWERALI